MNILHIVSSLDPKGGGPTRSITGLSRGLAGTGVDATLFVHSNEHVMPDTSGVKFHTGSGQISKILSDVKHEIECVQPDLAHLHGVWLSSNHIMARYLRKQKISYVIAPRGMLEPWSLNAKKWKKRLAMWLYQRRDLACAAALHATAISEAEQFRKLGFKQPIIVSPNGVDLPAIMPSQTTRKDGKKTILFLSRIHPKKGLMELVEAWAKVRRSALVADCRRTGDGGRETGNVTNELLNWHIEYAGPDYDGHMGEVQRKIKDLGLEADFTYLGDLSDVEKWTAYRRADVFVLPTYSENFGIVVAEALAAGVPVITTKGTPWQELEGCSCHSSLVGNDQKSEIGSQKSEVLCTNVRKNLRTNDLARTGRAGWWIDIGVEPLAEALRAAMSLSDEERHAMGENGRRLVEAKYTWPAIAEQMKAAYAWILNGGELPPSVMLE